MAASAVAYASGSRATFAHVTTDPEFSRQPVRIHDDQRAHKSVSAHAYTVGSDVVFQRGYDPSARAGRLALAHELTHVVQQRTGPVDGTPAVGKVRISNPSDQFEREAAANAERVISADTAGSGKFMSERGGQTRPLTGKTGSAIGLTSW